MPRFAANLSMLYPRHDFLERFATAAADGFEGVEYLFPYAYPATELKARLDDHGLRQVLFNAAPATGTRASAAWPACRGARPNSAAPSPRPSTMPRSSATATSMSWPDCCRPAPTASATARPTSTTSPMPPARPPAPG
ncbi:putative hydroxypyruvate isomerase [Pseudomonas aeruginosa]|nr:putative hydroxypyruvate isomerase [Pseudomonas aeruginosa]